MTSRSSAANVAPRLEGATLQFVVRLLTRTDLGDRRDHPGGGPRGAAARGGVEEGDAPAAARQLKGAGQSDDAATDDECSFGRLHVTSVGRGTRDHFSL